MQYGEVGDAENREKISVLESEVFSQYKNYSK